MKPEIITQRLAPTCDFLVAVDDDPEEALGRFAATRQAPPFWSLAPRVTTEAVPSVAGSNVTVRIRFPPLWLGVLMLLLIIVLIAGWSSFQLGPLDAGYAIASSKHVVWGRAAALAIGSAIVFLTIAGAFVWHLYRSRKKIVDALRTPSRRCASARSDPRLGPNRHIEGRVEGSTS